MEAISRPSREDEKKQLSEDSDDDMVFERADDQGQFEKFEREEKKEADSTMLFKDEARKHRMSELQEFQRTIMEKNEKLQNLLQSRIMQRKKSYDEIQLKSTTLKSKAVTSKLTRPSLLKQPAQTKKPQNNGILIERID